MGGGSASNIFPASPNPAAAQCFPPWGLSLGPYFLDFVCEAATYAHCPISGAVQVSRSLRGQSPLVPKLERIFSCLSWGFCLMLCCGRTLLLFPDHPRTAPCVRIPIC